MPQPPTVKVNGAAIRRIRLLSGTEMRDLAIRAGISRNYLSRIETGTRRHLRASTYAALRKALNATDNQLLATSEDEQQRTT